jgi:glycosyltransferase involved in cell wall biosynthesis
MKIAVITSRFLPQIGGAEIVIHNIINTMYNKGIDVTLYVPYGYYKSIKNKVPYKVKPAFFIGTITDKLPFLAKNLFKLYMYLLQRLNKYDVWNAHIAHYSGYFLSQGPKDIAKVLTFHGVDIQKCKGANYGFRLYDKGYEAKLQNEILPNIDVCTAISNSVRNELLSLNYPQDQIEMVPNGINIELFENNSKSKVELKKEFGFDENDFIILTSGRNHLKKGYKDIPYIAKILEDKGVKFKWILVGRGTESIQKVADKLELKNLIIKDQIGVRSENSDYTFPDGNMRNIYLMADCYAFPTIIEGLPMVILEAFASKLPVITTNVEGVEDFESCIKIDRDNDLIENFTNQIIKIKEDDIYRQKIIDTQYNEVFNKYALDIVVDKYIEAYKKAIDING